VYDVLYLDQRGSSNLVAAGLTREVAARTARDEARRRGVGRMFLAGSELPASGCAVLIVGHRMPRAA
jgi:hypothetical protein